MRGGLNARLGKQILSECGVDLRVGVLAEIALCASLIEGGGSNQIIELAEIVPAASSWTGAPTNTTYAGRTSPC